MPMEVCNKRGWYLFEDERERFPKLSKIWFDFSGEFDDNKDWYLHEEFVETINNYNRKYKDEILKFLKEYGGNNKGKFCYDETLIKTGNEFSHNNDWDCNKVFIDYTFTSIRHVGAYDPNEKNIPMYFICDEFDPTRNIQLYTYEEVEEYFKRF